MTTTNIPLAGNAFITHTSADESAERENISDMGLMEWFHEDAVCSIYLRFSQDTEATFTLGLMGPEDGTSVISAQVADNDPVELTISTYEEQDVEVGTFNISKGYVKIDLKGISKEWDHFCYLVNFLRVSNYEGEINYVPEGSFHFGRRGPSVHLNYQTNNVPVKMEYFYNEVSVPEGKDAVGMYAMAIGFTGGYFGMQHNEEKLRKILFSIWADSDENDPNKLKAEKQIKFVKKGSEDVVIDTFGGEGSGGKSYRPYDWKDGVAYRFLLRAVPQEEILSTQYSAWFQDPSVGEWELIARFLKPNFTTYVKGPHSFLENFDTTQGYIERRAHYGNQWARGTDGKWYEITSAKFTCDATAKRHERLDFTGGVEDGMFFLDNCGFCNNEEIKSGTTFKREPKGVQPDVNVDELP